MSPAHRFVDDGSNLSVFAGEVHVRCIRCDTAGVVAAERDGLRWTASFKCAACDLELRSSRGDWVGPVRLLGRRPCGHCGHKWLVARLIQSERPRQTQEAAAVACPECGHDTSIPLTPHRVYDGASNNDPHFGLPLLLVDGGRHGALWAYNAQHLRALKSYVAAALRQRSAEAGNNSMFSRLPAWMKSAKNREAISRRLTKLEHLLSNAQQPFFKGGSKR